MKKLMMVAMVAMAAIAANAAKVQWGVSDGSFAKISSGTMYLVWAESANFSGLDEMEKFDASTIASIGGTIVGGEGVGYVTYNGGAQTAQTVVKPTTPISIGNGQKKLYTMLISSDGKEFAYSTVSSTPILNNENTADISKAANGFTVVDAATPGPDPTPEPTTGMLMLVGLAGLALRRRRA